MQLGEVLFITTASLIVTMNTLNITIKTDNLLIRSITMDYKEQIYREFTGEIATYLYPKPPEDMEETARFIESSMKENQAGSNFQAVVLRKGTEEFLGCAAIHNIHTTTPELGIWLKKASHGKAYGREAVTALKEWADKNLDYEHLIYPVALENYPSRKIPEHLGGKVVKEYEEKNMSGTVLHILEYWIYPPVV